MDPVNADPLSSASTDISFSATISSGPSISLSSAPAIAVDPLRLPVDFEAASFPSIAIGSPLTSATSLPSSIAFPKPRAIPTARPEHALRDRVIQRALEILPGG